MGGSKEFKMIFFCNKGQNIFSLREIKMCMVRVYINGIINIPLITEDKILIINQDPSCRKFWLPQINRVSDVSEETTRESGETQLQLRTHLENDLDLTLLSVYYGWVTVPQSCDWEVPAYSTPSRVRDHLSGRQSVTGREPQEDGRLRL